MNRVVLETYGGTVISDPIMKSSPDTRKKHITVAPDLFAIQFICLPTPPSPGKWTACSTIQFYITFP